MRKSQLSDLALGANDLWDFLFLRCVEPLKLTSRECPPLPVEDFGERQDVGVRNDHGDAASLQHVTQCRLAQPSSTEDHTESGFLQEYKDR